MVDRIRRARGVRWWHAAIGGAMIALLIAVPSRLLPNPVFTRMTPVRWWDYLVLTLVTVLAAAWLAAPAVAGRSQGAARGTSSVVLSTLAVGCPLCNKVVIAVLGVSGALTVWAPLQPVLAMVSIAAMGAAVADRWGMRWPWQPRGPEDSAPQVSSCPDGTCGPGRSPVEMRVTGGAAVGPSADPRLRRGVFEG